MLNCGGRVNVGNDSYAFAPVRCFTIKCETLSKRLSPPLRLTRPIWRLKLTRIKMRPRISNEYLGEKVTLRRLARKCLHEIYVVPSEEALSS